MKATSFVNYQLSKNPLKVFPTKWGLTSLVWKKPPKFGLVIGICRDGLHLKVKREGIKSTEIYHPKFWQIKKNK